MKTSKPFSTISYNTNDYLTTKLFDLVIRRKIDFFAWVSHYAEEDEKKPHKHLLIVPNGKVDTDALLDFLIELDPSNPEKPLKCLPPKSSKFGDWYLYACHDSRYLAQKGQSREYHYEKNDFVVSDSDYFTELIHEIDMTKLYRYDKIKNAVDCGDSFTDLLASGIVPIQQISAFYKAYELLLENKTFRASKANHEIDCASGKVLIDCDTGEVLDD